MRVATVDGLVTLFYDGSKPLFNWELEEEWWEEFSLWCNGWDYDEVRDEHWEDWDLSEECKKYWKDRRSWQQIIVVEGVTAIPGFTFRKCNNIKRVIMADTVVRIEWGAFGSCSSLGYIKFSTHLEYIERRAFIQCNLSSVFVPPTCRAIRESAFTGNENLTIFNVPHDTVLGQDVISQTKLLRDSHFEVDKYGNYRDQTQVHNWLKNMNNDNKYSLHRACTSFQPLKEVLLTIVQAKGIGAFKVKNEAGVTPARYLKENPYADVDEMEITRDYIATMMGEYNN
ncbi:hypothetical protein CTEN210_02899 [Chaetoceros tenuissimus]|uniref:Leucine-rich repeat domain-containing protein n=1 Tax=Chaetoceros tenuissimus TaxID=426638 RepID=A0AAD3CKP1_9STRA|nr:hypothetical protein CTEN210_02899 [Chaetoceros tenuissimus]